MHRLCDKAVIFLISAIYLSTISTDVYNVAPLLAAVTVSMLTQYATNTRNSYIINSVYILLCFIKPAFCLGLPLAVYEMTYRKLRRLYPFAALAFICSFPTIQMQGTIFCLVGIFTALTLVRRTFQLADAKQKLIDIRDNSAELTNLLKDKNRRLIESQDNEIYTATLKERNRIAREIHDNVGHLLTRCLLQMGALIIITEDEEQKEHLQSVKDTLDCAMTSVRQSVHDLHDDSIDLEQTVREVAKSLADDFKLTLEYDCSESMPKNVRLAFIGIIKEALNNTAKYSSGDRAFISIQEFPAFYRLIVRDNGVNPCEQDIESKGNGIGLVNMHDRVRGLNGSIRIDSSEKGFKIFVSVPKPEELCTVQE